jgi:hypothetical protein
MATQTPWKGAAMGGKITIELRTEHTPDSGSRLPKRGHDAYWLMKALGPPPKRPTGGP